MAGSRGHSAADRGVSRAYILRRFNAKRLDPMSASDADNYLENRRKRLLYQSNYRGNKENDIILGRFARAHLNGFNAAELDQYEKLLANGDNDIFDWLSGRAEVPPEEDTPVLRQLMRFRVDLV
jgi:antitoxin CptB